MNKKYIKNDYPPYLIDEINGQPVLLVGLAICHGRIFLRLFDGNGVYKREVFFKK